MISTNRRKIVFFFCIVELLLCIVFKLVKCIQKNNCPLRSNFTPNIYFKQYFIFFSVNDSHCHFSRFMDFYWRWALCWYIYSEAWHLQWYSRCIHITWFDVHIFLLLFSFSISLFSQMKSNSTAWMNMFHCFYGK